MTTDLVVVDAFTSVPFAGNPAAICLLDGPAEEGWMRQVAAEVNLSETAFLHALDDGSRSLRWFTPTVEVELCGHATLASAHVLFSDGHAAADEVLRFQTRSGELTARRSDDGIELDFPRHDWEVTDEGAALAATLRIDPADIVGTARSNGNHVAELSGDALVRGLAPDLPAVEALPLGAALVTALGPGGEAGPDVVSRYFAPRYGIAEDPVTGSAHSVVGPWFAGRVGPVLRCHQASPRGGDLLVSVDESRVRLAGHAVTTMRTRLLV